MMASGNYTRSFEPTLKSIDKRLRGTHKSFASHQRVSQSDDPFLVKAYLYQFYLGPVKARHHGVSALQFNQTKHPTY